MNHTKRVRERVETLPQTIRDCEACGADESMAIRRSSLNEQFLADDVSLKCMDCWYVRVHGIPFEDPETFEDELSDRGRRVLDFTESDGEPNREQLAALGYIAASNQ